MTTTPTPSAWRNRIVRSGDALVSEITPNPANWRTHPKLQADALGAVLADVGVVQQVIINQRSGRLVDGHLRVALAEQHGETSVPAVWVDLDDDEERLILATLDPLAAMAETNRDALSSLLGDLAARGDALGAMLARLAASVALAEVVPPETFPEYGDDIETHYECPSCHYAWSGRPSRMATDVWYESDNPNGFRTGQRFSLDAPCLTVMADGLGGDSLGHWHFVRGRGGQMTAALTAADGKPAYRVPTMAEIAAVPWNGLAVASTFSGAGGSCLGYRMAGYRVAWANELVPIAAESYRANFPDTVLDTRDIRTVAGAEILAATGLGVGELDLLDGSPPCQPFSTAGKREKSWGQVRDYGDHKQRADDLFYEYVRLVSELRPRAFVAENVSGLVKGTAKGYFKRILAALKALGYVVEARLLDAQWLGVPQARQRIIFVGVREDLGQRPAFPSPLPYRYSVRDALPWIVHVQTGRDDWAPSGAQSSPTILASDGGRSSSTFDGPIGMVTIEGANGFNGHAGTSVESPAATVLADSVGTHWIEVENGWNAEDRRAGRVDPGEPSPSILQHGRGWNQIAVQEPVERRKFTIGELRRICAFPDDFVLCGSYAEQWARLGNAVPPVMMRHIAEAVRDGVLLPRSE